MANRTVKDAISIKGTNPQYLVEKITRSRIYESRYWKEECFALTAELLVDKAMDLKSIGGIYGGNTKPSPFLCLILKMLQIQPEKDIVIEFIRNEDFKYVRALGAFYMRLTGSSSDIYKYLEPLYIDYRKMKRMNKNAQYQLTFMDDFIDELLHSDRVCDVSLPRIQKRQVLEELNELEPRISLLDVNLDDVDTSSSSSSSDEAASSDSNRSGQAKRRRKENESSSRTHRDQDYSASKPSSSSSRHDEPRRGRRPYFDYDNPDPRDEIRLYRRSASPGTRRRRSRSRDRSRDRRRSRSDDREHSRHKSDKKKKNKKKSGKHRSRSSSSRSSSPRHRKHHRDDTDDRDNRHHRHKHGKTSSSSKSHR